MNAITIAGRVGKAAESRQAGDTTATSFSVATDKRGKGGEKETLWFDCTLWGDRGAKVAEHLTKGKVVAVSGEVGARAYMGKDGKPVATLTLRVIEMTLLGGGEKAEAAPQRQGGSRPAPKSAANDFDDSSIPF